MALGDWDAPGCGEWIHSPRDPNRRVAWPMHGSFMHDAKTTPDTNKTALATIQSSFDVRRHHRRDNGQAGGWCWWQGPCGCLAVRAQGQHAAQARRLLVRVRARVGFKNCQQGSVSSWPGGVRLAGQKGRFSFYIGSLLRELLGQLGLELRLVRMRGLGLGLRVRG